MSAFTGDVDLRHRPEAFDQGAMKTEIERTGSGAQPQGSVFAPLPQYAFVEPVESFKKFDQDKPRTDLLPARALLETARVMGHGAAKYGADNYRKGADWHRYSGALSRHMLAWQAGEDDDPESKINHVAHAAACALILLDLIVCGIGKDTRTQKPTPTAQLHCGPDCVCRKVAAEHAAESPTAPDLPEPESCIDAPQEWCDFYNATCDNCPFR